MKTVPLAIVTWPTGALASGRWESRRSPCNLRCVQVRVEQAQAGSVAIYDVGTCRGSSKLCRCTFLAEEDDLAAGGPRRTVAPPGGWAQLVNPRPIGVGDFDSPGRVEAGRGAWVGHEGNRLAVRRPRRLAESGSTAGERSHAGAIRVHRVDLPARPSHPGPDEGEPVARRPGWCIVPVRGGVPRQAADPAAVSVDDVDAANRVRDLPSGGGPRRADAADPMSEPVDMASVRVDHIQVVISLCASVVTAKGQPAAIRGPRRIPLRGCCGQSSLPGSVGAHQADVVSALVGDLATQLLCPRCIRSSRCTRGCPASRSTAEPQRVRNRDSKSDRHNHSRAPHGHPPDVPPVPSADALHQAGWRLLGSRDHRGAQTAFYLIHRSPSPFWRPASGAASGPAARPAADGAVITRSLASARDAWLLTAPTLQPMTAAACASERSSKYRSTSTARCLGGNSASARSSRSRSAISPA